MIESTSTYHRPVVHALADDFDPIIINPALAGSSKKKADKYDAGLLAYHGLTGIWEKSFIPSGLQHDLTVISRRLIKAKQGITRATNAIGSRLIDYNLLIPREIQVYSESGKSILQAIVEGVKNPADAVNRATYYSANLHIPDRKDKYQRLVEALTSLPNITDHFRQLLNSLMDEADFFQRQCLIYQNWVSELLQNMSISYKDGRTLSGTDIVNLLKTIPGVGTRFGEILIAEASIDIEKRFGNAQALESFAGFDPSKTYSADKVRSTKSKKGNKYIHTTTIQVAQSILQHGKQDNPLAKWGRLYKSRMGGTTAAHNRAVAGIGKRIIKIAYHIVRTGKSYDGSRYNFNVHQTKMVKRLKQVSKHVNEIVNEIHASETDESAKIVVSEAIQGLSSIAGIEGAFRLNPNIKDKQIKEFGFKKRICTILTTAGIINFSTLWFRIVQGTLMDIDYFGKKSYAEVIEVLVDAGYIFVKDQTE